MTKITLESLTSIGLARWCLLLIAFILPMAIGAPIPPQAKKPRIDYFPTRVGSKWVWKNNQNEDWQRTDIITSIEEVDGAKLIHVGTVNKNGTVEHRESMRLSQEGLFQVHKDQEGINSSHCFLKFPIELGAKWECFFAGEIGNAICERIEEIEVPAGRFNAVKVVVTSKPSNIRGGKAIGWFAIGIGPVKWGGRTTEVRTFFIRSLQEQSRSRITPVWSLMPSRSV
jgi:hypothetical protein